MFLQIYLEYCVGGSVDGIMHELERPLSEAQIACVCSQVCAALEFIHSCYVIHRDLKAGNILLNAEGLAKLGLYDQHVHAPLLLVAISDCQFSLSTEFLLF